MPTSQGTLKPFVTVSGSSSLYNSVSYPVGGNVTSSTSATFKASFKEKSNVIHVTYVTSGTIVSGMSVSGIGLPTGATILGPLNQNGTATGGTGTYTINMLTNDAAHSGNQGTYANSGNAPIPSDYGKSTTAGSSIVATAIQSNNPQGPGGIVGPVPGFNCVNIMELRDYYNLPYPPATPLASPPVIAIVSFGGGIYGQPVTTGQYAGFWKCTDISGNNGAPIQILVAPINGAINAPNADDGGATLENTVDVATVNAFYGMIDPRRDAPIYTPPVIILYIAPSSDISEMYRTFYTVLKNPVVCNGKSYQPTVVSCSWGAPEIAWTQKMAFPPNPSIPVDNSPNPSGIAEINEINDLFAEATKNGINICCASGDIPLSTVNSSVNTFNYAQQLLLQGMGGPLANTGFPTGQVPVAQTSVFPLSDAERASLPPPQVMFPASSPYVTCVGGSAVYFPLAGVGSYENAAEFAWARGNGGISTVFSIPAYQQHQPGAAATSAAQFLASSLNTANLAELALGTPVPNGGNAFPDAISHGITAPNTGVTLSKQMKDSVYETSLASFNAAAATLQAAQSTSSDDTLLTALVDAMKSASTALTTAKNNKNLATVAKTAAEDVVVKTQSVSELLRSAGVAFGAAAASVTAVSDTLHDLQVAQFDAQQAAYANLVSPTSATSINLHQKNQALQAAETAYEATALAAKTLPASVPDTTSAANKAVAQAASAIIAPTLSSHPFVQGAPVSSRLVPTFDVAVNSVQIIAGDLPYDESATTAPSYLLTSLGLGYMTDYANSEGRDSGDIRSHLDNAVRDANLLTQEFVVKKHDRRTGDVNSTAYSTTDVDGPLATLTNTAIAVAQGQLASSGSAFTNAGLWAAQGATYTNTTLPAVAHGFTDASGFASRAKNIAGQGASFISKYVSGAGNANIDGYNLPCGLASAAASALAAVFNVENDQKKADKDAGFPYGSTDIYGGIDASGTYTGLTAGLINLRNIYANTTLAARRTQVARDTAHAAKQAFLDWAAAKESVDEIQSQATTLYGLVPAASTQQVREMDAKLLEAKTLLSAASFKLAEADNKAVVMARLAQQSAASASACMGNWIDASGTGAKFDELGNLTGIPSSTMSTGAPITVPAQGANNNSCPAIKKIVDSGSVVAKEALNAAQSMVLAAANDNYLTTSVTTWNTHGITGVDTSGNQTVSLIGTRLLVEDAQFAAAGAAGQVATVAFEDATESMARFTDWENVSLAANYANIASQSVYTALTDASDNKIAGTTKASLLNAVDAITRTLAQIVGATTPFNQQATVSATIATNNVVALAAKLENVKAVCMAAQSAIQLAASTYSSTSSNISGAAGNGGSIFTVNMAYAKVTADAAQAACTAAAILAREQAVLAARRANYSAIALRKLVGEGVIGGAIAGFVDANGHLVAQTGYGYLDSSGSVSENVRNLPFSASGGNNGVNGIKPPAVTAMTILYQGAGGLQLDSSGSFGNLQGQNLQPGINTNLAYTTPQATNVYGAVKNLTEKAQLVIDKLQSDSSGNPGEAAATVDAFLKYPNVNAANSLDGTLVGGLEALRECLLAAYEAQQWVVSAANASFVTFGYSAAHVNLVNFTPSLLGVASKLASDADSCLQTVLSAEASILYALSQRPNRVDLHDLDAATFASVFNANQAAADTYNALYNAAIEHEMNTHIAYHNADLTNAFSPLAASAAIAAGQATALGAMSWSGQATNPNYASNTTLNNAGFPAAGWGSASMPSNSITMASQNFNSTNPNLGPYNGTATGAAPYPVWNYAANSMNVSRPQAPAAQVLQVSSNALNKLISDTALLTTRSVNDASMSVYKFGEIMVQAATVTPSLVDAATDAANKCLDAAKSSNNSTRLVNTGTIGNNQTNTVASLLLANADAILEARTAARVNLESTARGDARYISRQNMLNLWNLAVDAVRLAVDSCDNAPVRTADGVITNASLGDISIMGSTTDTATGNNNSHRLFNPASSQVVYDGPKGVNTLQPSILSLLNEAVINAYNATTGCIDASGNYRYISFKWPDASGSVVTNMPENNTNFGWIKAMEAASANSTISNAARAALLSARNAIKAAYDAAVAVDASNEAILKIVRPATGGVAQARWDAVSGQFTDSRAKSSMAVDFWNGAMQYADVLASGYVSLSADSLAKLMSIVGINFDDIVPSSNQAVDVTVANYANIKQKQIMDAWALDASGTYLWGSGGIAANAWPGYTKSIVTNDYALVNSNVLYGTAYGTYFSNNGTVQSNLAGGNFARTNYSAFYFTQAIMSEDTAAYQTAKEAWDAVLLAYNAAANGTIGALLSTNAGKASNDKATAVYSVKVALQAAYRAGKSGEAAASAVAALAKSSQTFEDISAAAAAETTSVSTANLNMYRCVPDISMHANADDLPVIFRLNGGNVYVGGTAVAASMFAGFLGVVQSHAPVNFFVNPVLYDNYTYPSPLFNDISGSKQVWYAGSENGSIPPARIANVLPGQEEPTSGVGSGLYNCNTGLGSIKAINLAALMEVPHLVSNVSPSLGDNAQVTVYPGTSQTVTAYVEPVTAYNPHLVWSISSQNATISQTNGPRLSNNGANDTDPYTPYDPLQSEIISKSISDHPLGSVGTIALGTNPYHLDSSGNEVPCLVFTATVTGVTSVPASAPLPVITVSSTDGSSVYGTYSVVVLPSIQVTGVSISAANERENPANTTLFLGTTKQLVSNVTPYTATNKRVYWWSSNTSIVNVDASGLLTSLAPGQVTIKATSVNNNISASISVYVPTPITGISVLPTTITLNPNLGAIPLKNLGLIRAIIQPAEADYKHLTWEVVSSTQAQPAPAGITDVVSLPRNGTVLARDSSGDITDNTEATVTALSNGSAVLKVSTYGEPYGVYGTYTSMVTVNVVTPITDVVMTEKDMVINLNPHTSQYDSDRSLPETYKITATLKPAYPSNMNVFWSSSNPKVGVVSNNSPAVLNTNVGDVNFGLWQITETITPLSNGTTVIKVTTADGSKVDTTTVVVTTPVTGLSMSALPIVLNPTKLYTLQATVLPTTATNRALIWESTNTAVATVDANGVVKAVTSGSCGISATTVDGDYSAIAEVSVVTPLVGVQLMVNTPLPIHINDVVQILVVMVPTTSSNQQFTWTVTDGVDGNIFTTGPAQNGNIVYLDAVQAGSSVFTVTTADGNKQASINLQVVQW